MSMKQFKILIVGGGSGGISLAARLARLGFRGQIGLIEPSETHDYQPLWTLAGVGLVAKEKTRKSEADFIPTGVEWIKDSVTAFHPERNAVTTSATGEVRYDALIVATGLELNFEKIKGLEGHLGRDGLFSVYQYDQVDAAAQMIRSFVGGTAIFTMPPVPIKCAGAPQKVMYLADNLWRQRGVRDRARILFTAAGPVIFGVKEFAEALTKVVKRKGIEALFQYKLVEVIPSRKVAIFDVTEATPDGPRVTSKEIAYDIMHVVPPMSAPKVVRDSVLASAEEGQKGWLEVDKFTLQHKRFPNVFGIGDVTGVPNSKTGAAIRKQAPVLAENVRSFLAGVPLPGKYDGYASCPLITEVGKVMLAEFGYDGKLMPTFPLDPTKERRLYWHLKKDLLPPMYWYGMLKGRL
jgi:sulfide:quinone oxidoreductase